MSWLKNLRSKSDDGHVVDQQPSQSDKPTPQNRTLFQTFEWHTPSKPPPPNETHSPSSHYARITGVLPTLAELGITSIWLPPGCKANSPQGNGYDCYDLWDLGEFDQKWARSTKWGSREELGDLMGKARSLGMESVWDAVLNHKTAGDGTEECWAVEVDKEDRRRETSTPRKIEPWIKYDFPGRGDKYSSLKWRACHFNGTDWDQRAQKNAIYKIIDDPSTFPRPGKENSSTFASSGMLGMNRMARLAGKVAGVPVRRPGKGWAEDVDDLHGNFDYLMFSNIDYAHPEVRQEVLNWGQWMVQDIGVDGFRLDAVQHFSFNYTRDWIEHVQRVSRQKNGKEALMVGEIWTGEVRRILSWLNVVGPAIYAYDSPLLYSFSRISEDVRTGSKNADLRTVYRDSLVECRPEQSVTLVTNHDTQPGQTSYTPIDRELKALFYAIILLRQEGYPCVFWGDLYGTKGPHAEPPACGGLLASLMLSRKCFAHGAQTDYFDAASCIGWTRAGTYDRPGCAVVISIGPSTKYTQKKMAIGKPGEVWKDVLGDCGEVEVDTKGNGVLACKGMSVSVYVRNDLDEIEQFPAKVETNVYD